MSQTGAQVQLMQYALEGGVTAVGSIVAMGMEETSPMTVGVVFVGGMAANYIADELGLSAETDAYRDVKLSAAAGALMAAGLMFYRGGGSEHFAKDMAGAAIGAYVGRAFILPHLLKWQIGNLLRGR